MRPKSFRRVSVQDGETVTTLHGFGKGSRLSEWVARAACAHHGCRNPVSSSSPCRVTSTSRWAPGASIQSDIGGRRTWLIRRFKKLASWAIGEHGDVRVNNRRWCGLAREMMKLVRYDERQGLNSYITYIGKSEEISIYTTL